MYVTDLTHCLDRYAILYRWAGDRLRFFLPATIAPRFGGPPHHPHQAPEAALAVENRFSLRVEVFGDRLPLRQARRARREGGAIA